MNIYDIRNFIDNASDSDVTMLHSCIIAEHNRCSTNKAAAFAGIDNNSVKAERITDCYSNGPFLDNNNVIELIKQYRQESGKGLAESKHHIEKAIKQRIVEILDKGE